MNKQQIQEEINKLKFKLKELQDIALELDYGKYQRIYTPLGKEYITDKIKEIRELIKQYTEEYNKAK